MMKCYILVIENYDNTDVIKVFLDKNKAEENRQKLIKFEEVWPKISRNYYSIIESEVEK